MSLPRYRRPRISPIGRATKRKRPTRAQSYAIVARRAKGKCELDGTPQDPLDPHHVFGRGHLFGIPSAVCELPEMLLGVCRRCHSLITGETFSGIDESLDDRAKHLAVQRFCERFDLEYDPLCEDWVAELRRIIREAPETSALTSFLGGV